MGRHLDRYLDQLPEGWASFPDCCAKAVLFTRLLGLRRDAWIPPELAERLERPPLPTAWTPEVEQVALLLAILDDRVHTPADERAFHAEMLELNLALFRSPAYAPLVQSSSPGRLIRMLSESWHLFHRGTAMTLADAGEGHLHIDLRFPPALFPEAAVRARMTSVRGALMAASAEDVSVSYRYEEAGYVRYEARWSTG